jgi:23S rRNA pseudouridine1911/1915/1917 synthase
MNNFFSIPIENQSSSDEEGECFVLSAEESNERLDKILARRFQDEKSRTYFQYLFSLGRILVNGNVVKKQYKAREGDLIEIQFLLPPEMEIKPEPIPLDIVFEDEALLIVNKPAGMLVHPAPPYWTGTFVNALLYHCKQLTLEFKEPGVRPGIVHRLDKDTSGILVAAKTPQALLKLSTHFQERRVYKEYIGICLGSPGRGIINAPIGRSEKNRKQMAVVTGSGKEAITEFETIRFDGQVSAVKIILRTGRTHQIRVHMQHRKTPILGDALYGNAVSNKRYGASRQLLHAYKIGFPHPFTSKPMIFTASYPQDIDEWMKKLERMNIHESSDSKS